MGEHQDLRFFEKVLRVLIPEFFLLFLTVDG